VPGNRRLGRYRAGWHGAQGIHQETDMADADWVRVASVADVAEGQVHAVRLGDREVALYHLPGGEFRATDNICTHEYALLSDGWLEDGCIECPLHAARFDIRTGRALCAPAEENLKVFEVKVEGDNLLLKAPA
jgi:nitrite reductase/ring-hydroxylating ferredoxin subunit